MRRNKNSLTIYNAIILVLIYFFLGILVHIPTEVISRITIFLNDQMILICFADILSVLLIMSFVKNRYEFFSWKVFIIEKDYFKILLPIMIFLIGSKLVLNQINSLIDIFIPMSEGVLQVVEGVYGNKPSIVGLMILFAVVGPICEEIFYRGIILSGLLKRYPEKKSIFLSALIFAIIHMNPWQFPTALIMGLFFGWVFTRTRSIILCIVAHIFYNMIPFIKGYIGLEAYSYNNIIRIGIVIIGLILMIISVYSMIRILKKIDHANSKQNIGVVYSNSRVK